MNKKIHSNDRLQYLKKMRREKIKVYILQGVLLIACFGIWELLAQIGVIDGFITSQPSRVYQTLRGMVSEDLYLHILTTCYETIVGFLLGVLIGILIASLLWWFPTFAKICDPYLVVLNALPKIALGPIIIIMVGAGTNAIIVMALAISLITTVLQMYNGFFHTDQEKCKMIEAFGATKWQLFSKVVFPSNLATLFNSMKINIGLSLVGVIAGEFLVSKAGLGYLIVYGGQVFRMDLVMTSVLILAVVAAILYVAVSLLEKYAVKWINHR
jgi:NitT/TauT family transport system permease protein